ncbi:MAG: hypothetical protein KKE64_06605, partial [Candidatus Omnitrophica bacterium]|nr:hypothetical protein [Candidatus Omnitrophota bacterium]
NSDKTFLVGFKFSPRARVKTLLLQAKELLRLTKSDIIVANRFKNNRYLAYLVTKNRIYGSYNNKAGLTGRLTSLLEEKL